MVQAGQGFSRTVERPQAGRGWGRKQCAGRGCKFLLRMLHAPSWLLSLRAGRGNRPLLPRGSAQQSQSLEKQGGGRVGSDTLLGPREGTRRH